MLLPEGGFMATPVQCVWSASSGLYLVPRNSETTAKPFAPVEMTGGTITYADFGSPPQTAVSSEEQEWVSLLASERKSLAKRRIKPGEVNKAIQKLRYHR
jgi:hypothetical protein